MFYWHLIKLKTIKAGNADKIWKFTLHPKECNTDYSKFQKLPAVVFNHLKCLHT